MLPPDVGAADEYAGDEVLDKAEEVFVPEELLDADPHREALHQLLKLQLLENQTFFLELSSSSEIPSIWYLSDRTNMILELRRSKWSNRNTKMFQVEFEFDCGEVLPQEMGTQGSVNTVTLMTWRR